jgi:hypothetical protein
MRPPEENSGRLPPDLLYGSKPLSDGHVGAQRARPVVRFSNVRKDLAAMQTALVRGPQPRIAEIAAALRREGFQVMVSPNVEPCPRLSEPSLHCYVGMPPAPGSGSADAVRAILATVDDLTSAAPFLSPDAKVLLVTHGHDGDRGFDAAVRLLATRVVADHGGVGVTVRHEPCSPADIASVVSSRASDLGVVPQAGPIRQPTAPAASLADLAPHLDYVDWRNEILTRAGERDGTYFGWVNHRGEPVVAVLRSTVLTPLRPLAAEGTMAWGQPGDGTRPLAGAMLSDLLGRDARCPVCQGASENCRSCDGTGLSPAMIDLADWLAKELLSDLPAEGFELPASSVRAWIGQAQRP